MLFRSLIKNAPHSHKTDRYPTAEFFDGWTYSTAEKEGSTYLATRIPLSDLADKKDDLKKTRQALEQLIVSPDTRRYVLAAFDERVKAGETPKLALSKPVKMSGGFGTDIWKVKVFQKSVGRPGKNGLPLVPSGRAFELQLKPGRNQKIAGKKYLPHNGYAFLARFKLAEDSEFMQAESVRPIFANTARLVHKNCHKLFRCDTVTIPGDDDRWIIHQIRQDGELAIAPLTEAGTWEQIGDRGGRAKAVKANVVLKMVLT